MKDNLEKAFHDALIDHELAYDPAAWNALQKRLPTSKTPWYIAGAAATVVVAIVLFAVFQNNESGKKEIAKNQQITNIQSQEKKENNVIVDQVNGQVEQSNGGTSNKLEQNASKIATKASNNSADVVNKNNENNTTTNLAKTDNSNKPSEPVDFSDAQKITESWTKAIEDIKIQGTRRTYCENSNVTFEAVGVPKNARIEWSFNNDDRIVQGNFVQFKAEKNMNVEMHVIPADRVTAVNPVNITSIKLNVVEVNKPMVEVDAKEQNTKNFVTLNNTNTEVNHLVWRFENNTFKGQSCSTYLTTKGMHNYVVESYDGNGCFASTQGQVEVKEDYNLFVQNTFTPNIDGINEYFIPEALKMRAVNFKMSIFDKTGKLIYSTTDVHAAWNGTFNGQPVAQDTYVWTVTLINEEGLPEQYKGLINVSRP